MEGGRRVSARAPRWGAVGGVRDRRAGRNAVANVVTLLAFADSDDATGLAGFFLAMFVVGPLVGIFCFSWVWQRFGSRPDGSHEAASR